MKNIKVYPFALAAKEIKDLYDGKWVKIYRKSN